ncbi:MAG: hypothetical protein J6K77_07570 [Ruminococcus sp.]|nr:hypothetical protein [Ruminococcus sp.]
MKYRLPTVREYYILKYSRDVMQVYETARAIAGEFSEAKDFGAFCREYLEWVDGIRAADPLLQIPYYPDFPWEKRYYNCGTKDIKMVSDYTRLDFNQVCKLPITQFWAWLRDGFIYNCECDKTGQGLEYLEKAYYNSQKEPGREAFRELKGASGNGRK